MTNTLTRAETYEAIFENNQKLFGEDGFEYHVYRKLGHNPIMMQHGRPVNYLPDQLYSTTPFIKEPTPAEQFKALLEKGHVVQLNGGLFCRRLEAGELLWNTSGLLGGWRKEGVSLGSLLILAENSFKDLGPYAPPVKTLTLDNWKEMLGQAIKVTIYAITAKNYSLKVGNGLGAFHVKEEQAIGTAMQIGQRYEVTWDDGSTWKSWEQDSAE